MTRTLMVLAIALLSACARTVPVGVTELVYASQYGPGHPFSRADREWMAFIERRSGGTLRIRPSWSGALLSSEHSMLELRHGVADIGLITPIYVKAGVQLIRIQSGFYSNADSVEKQLALYRCIEASSPVVDAELAGLKILAVQGGSLPGVLTRDRPVRRLADLKGMRLRAPTELLAVLKDLGADPVNMPMGQVYSALAKGVIDGVIAPPDTFKALHFADVAKYFTSLEVPRGAYPARAMSLTRWQSLTPAQQQVLTEGIPVWEAALARQTREAVGEGIAVARAGGVTFLPIAAADQAQFDRLYLEDADRNARALTRYGIDGQAVFKAARASIKDDGAVTCQRSI